MTSSISPIPQYPPLLTSCNSLSLLHASSLLFSCNRMPDYRLSCSIVSGVCKWACREKPFLSHFIRLSKRRGIHLTLVSCSTLFYLSLSLPSHTITFILSHYHLPTLLTSPSVLNQLLPYYLTTAAAAITRSTSLQTWHDSDSTYNTSSSHNLFFTFNITSSSSTSLCVDRKDISTDS